MFASSWGIGRWPKRYRQDTFINWSSYNLISVDTEDVLENPLLIGDINNDKFTNDLYRFLIEILQFKLFAPSGEVRDASYLSNEELLGKIADEEPALKKPKKIEISPLKNQYGQFFLEVHHII
jgi:hypothetical protein